MEQAELARYFASLQSNIQKFSESVKNYVISQEELVNVQCVFQTTLYSIEDCKRILKNLDAASKKPYMTKLSELELRFYMLDHELITVQKKRNIV
ncbi:Xaa-Pro aminopeptidase [Acrasis kona]|uniref:Xaa-Pro aminopeptidase n=1 Tax=Acrasis kona TaxID=1008807 RepID=A0AAW2ZC82_9EUKA